MSDNLDMILQLGDFSGDVGQVHGEREASKVPTADENQHQPVTCTVPSAVLQKKHILVDTIIYECSKKPRENTKIDTAH